jgi:DNA-binding SARP family transcriptional activator
MDQRGLHIDLRSPRSHDEVTDYPPGMRRLDLLGTLSYWDGATTVALHGSAGAVVALVALSPAPVERSVVAGTIWGEVGDSRANGNLRSTLWRLRKAAPDLVHECQGRLAIDHEVSVDHRDVAAWADRLLRGAATDADLDRRISPVDMELLPGHYDDWVVFERERLRQRLLHAVESLALAQASRGRFGDAIESAMVAIAADPMRESAHRVAVQCHLAEHNLVEAHREQLSYVRMMRHELGVLPSDEFMDLVPSSVRESLGQPGVDVGQRL